MTKIMTVQEEFSRLYLEVKPNIERFALVMRKGNVQDAKDLVSDALAEAFANFEQINSKKAFMSYLFTIIRRKSYRIKSRGDELKLDYASNDLSPEELTDLELLYNALDKLKPGLKELIIMHEVNGLSIKEIAEIEGISESAVKVRLFRARKKVRKILKIEEDSERSTK